MRTSVLLFSLCALAANACIESDFVPLPDDVTPPETVPGEPIADAGADRVVAPLSTVTLDGTASYDPEGLAITAYQWKIVGVPAGSTVANVQGQTTDNPTPALWLDIAGDYTFELTVQNEKGAWDSTPDRVVVTAEPAQDFYVQLTWDAVVDLDLHLLQAGKDVFSSGDCNYCNMSPVWFPGQSGANPSLDWDVVTEGFGPETITIPTPNDGTYRVGVHYYGQNGAASCAGYCPPTKATVRVYISGQLSQTFERTIEGQGTLWNPTDITVVGSQVSIANVDAVTATSKTFCY